jgi:hypothetical protein
MLFLGIGTPDGQNGIINIDAGDYIAESLFTGMGFLF